jgi:hypothetical protein
MGGLRRMSREVDLKHLNDNGNWRSRQKESATESIVYRMLISLVCSGVLW